MKFYKIRSSKSVVDFIHKRLSSHLERDELVLWLLSGGSAIDIEVEVAKLLSSHPNRSNLTVGLVDERYGPIGHADSNWGQLSKAGFAIDGAQLLNVLSGKDMESTAQEYESLLKDHIQRADFSLAIAGIGTDGHALGIKPNSPAVVSDHLVVAYEWDDYSRITTTSKVIKAVDEVVVYAVGPEKLEQLKKLREDLDPNLQPAQALKLCEELAIFTDQQVS